VNSISASCKVFVEYRPTGPNIKVDLKRFQTYKVCPPSFNHRYIHINVIDNTILGLNSIHVPVQHPNISLYCLQQISLLESTDLCIYQCICCQRNEQQIKRNMMLAASGSRLLIAFFVMPPMRQCKKRK
jgi:hypothetical protein